MDRPLTDRERAVLDALLAGEFEGAGAMREQRQAARVVGVCGCGCPSIDFAVFSGVGMTVLVDANVVGTDDGLFLFAMGDQLGGIEYVSNSDQMAAELPDPAQLQIY
ncbi:hypothetical protein KUV85_02170 [Nocardioides panacisoli]|uniref:hypothetical protein n=1 Tax=Nocardioides panacisoli TaxID=627624 RepID=UPI001C63AF4A|nr:hypothetical protein [Nocardioides panacisoli]QYJ04509.1 hypothetical protein KUV85_02170 [Nocardioides panacisoli]